MTPIAEEVQIGRVLVPWLRDQGWEVYQEIQISAYSHILDVAATRGPVLWAIEMKRHFTWKLLEQAARWTRQANYVSVAVPEGTGTMSIQGRVLNLFGIGSLRLVPGPGTIIEEVKPALRRTVGTRLRRSLRDEHKTFAEAGNSACRRWSPFKATCEEAAGYVLAHPGCRMKELVDDIHHHYRSTATARTALAKWIDQGLVDGVEARREGRSVFLHPTGRNS